MEENYKIMLAVCKDLLESEKDVIANLSNISSVIKFYMQDTNWAGFYIFRGNQLVLGPFQGLPACIRINMGKGVCGTAAEKMETLIVDNVHEFEGHIACDSSSNSEIVLPIIVKDKIYGVLDIDSTKFNRFSDLEKKYLESIVALIENFLEGEHI